MSEVPNIIPSWYIGAIHEVAKHLAGSRHNFDAETKTWNIDGVTLTPPGGEGAEDGKWVVGVETLIPGVRYTRNGDGWPDEIDWEEDSQHPLFPCALRRVAEILGARIADNALEYAQCSQDEETWAEANHPFSGSF